MDSLASNASCPVCAYCGQRLRQDLYFCTRCGTPHCHPDAILGGPILPLQDDGERIRERAPRVWRLFWTVAALLFLGVLLQLAVVESAADAADLMRLLSFLLLAVTLGWGIWNRQALLVQLRRPGFLQWEGWAALASLALLIPLNFGLQELFNSLLAGQESGMRELTQALSAPEIIVYLCVFPAIVEEILFRGLIQHWMQVAVSPWKAIVYTSALFVAVHLSALMAPYLFLLGLILGWAKWRTGSLYPSMLVHFLHNYLVLAAVL